MDIRRVILERPLPADELISLFGELPKNAPRAFGAVTTDSRLCRRGDLFFALGGGENFVPQAVAAGAIAVSTRGLAQAIRVSDARDALLTLAARYRETVTGTEFIAVTGSYGKTTTKEFLAAMLSHRGNVCRTAGNQNNAIGVAMTLFSLQKSDRYAVMEAGMNHAGELSALSRAIKPDYAIITGIGHAHIGHFGSREKIAAAKREVLDGMERREGRLLIPAGEPLLAAPGALTVSLTDEAADFFLMPERIGADGSRAVFRRGDLSFRIETPLAGRDVLECLAFAIGAALLLGTPVDDILHAIGTIRAPVRRFCEQAGDLTICNDYYNSSPEAVLAAFAAADLQADRPRSLLLGDMEELGGMTLALHKQIGAEAARHGFRKLYFFGKYAPFLANGAIAGGAAESDVFCNPDRFAPERTARQIAENAIAGEYILCKASHSLELGRVVCLLATLRSGREGGNEGGGK